MKRINAANSITTIRIIGTICLLFTKSFSKEFFIIYAICGLSDVFDGFIARITKTTSAFGAKFDSVADLVFSVVAAFKAFPELFEKLPLNIWYAVGFIVVLRLISYLAVTIKYRRFASLHSRLNKIAGVTVFMIPFMLKTMLAVTYCAVACAISAVSTVHEVLLHLLSKEYKGK